MSRSKRDLEERVKELERKLAEVEDSKTNKKEQEKHNKEKRDFDRRDFMKVLGGGAATLGAATLLGGNASAFNIYSDNGVSLYPRASSTNSVFGASSTGNVKADTITDTTSGNTYNIDDLASGSSTTSSGGTTYTTSKGTADTVFDTSGRYLGQLSGNNDAQVVIDALSDRNQEAGIIIPDPGFPLDWNKQVNIPANEWGFTIQTRGLPTVSIPDNFSGNHAIKKPSSGRVYGVRIGGFHFTDPSKNLNPAISLEDVKESVIEPSLFFNCPAIEITTNQDNFPNQNKIYGPFIKGSFDGSRQAGIKLGGTDGTADQNWVFYPHYVENTGGSWTPPPKSIAYHDQGSFNNWLHTRAENAKVVHLFEGSREYTVISGGWDRSQYFPRTVEERMRDGPEGLTNARGHIKLKDASNYAALDLISSQTRVECRGQHIDRPHAQASPEDVLTPLRKVTGARSLESMGLRDSSNGGNVQVGGTYNDHPQMVLNANGGHAQLDLGQKSMKAHALPKAAYGFGGSGGSRISHGLYFNDGNRAELVSDGGNWRFEVAINGNVKTKNMGVGPGAGPGWRGHDRQVHSICVLQEGEGQVEYIAKVGKETKKNIVHDDKMGQLTYRWRVEGNGTWKIDSREDMRLYRL